MEKEVEAFRCSKVCLERMSNSDLVVFPLFPCVSREFYPPFISGVMRYIAKSNQTY